MKEGCTDAPLSCAGWRLMVLRHMWMALIFAYIGGSRRKLWRNYLQFFELRYCKLEILRV